MKRFTACASYRRMTVEIRSRARSRPMKRFVLSLALAAIAFTAHAQRRDLDAFFNQFSDEWVRNTPNLAVSNRYFVGDEQASLERQLTRLDDAYQRERVERARRGLASLAQFDRAAMTEAQRLSADVLQYQLQTIVDGEQYRDYSFPFEQMRGAHVGLIDALTVSHPLQSGADARNYQARLELMSARLDEAVVDAQAHRGEGLHPASIHPGNDDRSDEDVRATGAASQIRWSKR